MKMLLRLVINAAALIGVAYLFPGIEVSGFVTALVVAIVLALVNLFFKPILVILTLPVTIVTLGLFTLVINGFLFWLVARFIDGFSVTGFWTAILGSIVFSVISYLGHHLLIDEEKD